MKERFAAVMGLHRGGTCLRAALACSLLLSVWRWAGPVGSGDSIRCEGSCCASPRLCGSSLHVRVAVVRTAVPPSGHSFEAVTEPVTRRPKLGLEL